MNRCFVVTLLFLVFTASAWGNFEYALDDGAGNWNIGPSAWPADMLWGNYFVAEPGFETIDSISVSFGSEVQTGRQVELVLFEDPTDDHDPADAIPLTSLITQATATPQMNEFVTFDIEDNTVSGGFFVAVVMDAAQGENVARMDPDTLGTDSWIIFAPDVNNNDLGSHWRMKMENHTFDGTWMIRANGIPEPVSILQLLALTALAIRRRR